MLVGLPCRPSSIQTQGCQFPFPVEQSSCLESTIHPECKDVKTAANNLDKIQPNIRRQTTQKLSIAYSHKHGWFFYILSSQLLYWLLTYISAPVNFYPPHFSAPPTFCLEWASANLQTGSSSHLAPADCQSCLFLSP